MEQLSRRETELSARRQLTAALPPCRLCQHEPINECFTVRGHRLARCPQCDFLQVVDQPSAEELRAIYSETYFAPSKYADEATLRAESDRRLNLLRQFVPPGKGKTVLDAGCATGHFISHAKHEYRFSGLELSESAVMIARQRNPELAGRIHVGSLDPLEWPEEQFDAICLWDVIEHMWDPLAVCRSLMARLTPGGHLLLSTPAADAPIARIMGRYWAFMTPPEHLSFFSRRSFDHLFRTALGAKVRSWRRMGKRANVGFLMYKLRRIFPMLVPEAAIRLFRRPALSSWAVYVPTGDVLYGVVQKPASGEGTPLAGLTDGVLREGGGHQ